MATASAEFLDRIPHEFARRHLILSAGTVVAAESTSAGVAITMRGTDNAGQGGAATEALLVAESTKPLAIHNVGFALKRSVITTLASPESIAVEIDRAYAQAKANAQGQNNRNSNDPNEVPSVIVEGTRDVEGELASAVREAELDVLSTHGKAPSVRLVDLLLFEAILRGASDLHVQPVRDRTLVRYRMDGTLHTVRELPGALASSVVSRIKVMARLDVAEHRAPQDGRATVTVGGSIGGSGSGSGNGLLAHGSADAHVGRRVDLRVSTLPSTNGERVVMRLLDPARSPHLLSLASLGMPDSVRETYLSQVSRTNGIVLSTGPTGSGKTTTLYTTLAWINSTNTGARARSARPQRADGHGAATVESPSSNGARAQSASTPRDNSAGRGCEVNILTIEDPVEYDLSGPGLSISQTQVDPKKNVTFATGLRHILRQDPDVIMLGEIRDEETARMAVQAALTGHLVLSTLHTNDAASAVARLLDLGVEPFLVASSLSAVLAQRLVRTLHQSCKGAGCVECLHSGFKGRTGIFELLVVDSAVHDLIGTRASALDIKAAAQRGTNGRSKNEADSNEAGSHDHTRGGMVTLREAGMRLVAQGITTEAELARVISVTQEEVV